MQSIEENKWPTTNDLMIDETLTDAKSNEEISHNAAVFANVNRAASAIVPLITQEFEARFKGNDRAFHILGYSEASHLAGKTVKATVKWERLNEYFWLNISSPVNGEVLVHGDHLKEVFTQKGKIKAMCEFWKDASGYNKRNN